MEKNIIRTLFEKDEPTVATRMWSIMPLFAEAVGATGIYDYVEFVAEYSPFTLPDLANYCRACELHNLGSMIKIDFQNRGYWAQKAIASGFMAVMFTDCRTMEEVKESIKMVKPETPEDKGIFGFPNGRFIGFQPRLSQMDHAKRQKEIVCSFMIEKKETVENLESIMSVKGIDMVQFGPSDFSMSSGFNAKDHVGEVKEAEEYMIRTALKHGIRPRCEIQDPKEAIRYMDLGVKDFCLGDQMWKYIATITNDGNALRSSFKERKK